MCDLSPEYNNSYLRFSMSLIGALLWIIEFGQIDLTCEENLRSVMTIVTNQFVCSLLVILTIHHWNKLMLMFRARRYFEDLELDLSPC